MMPLPHRLTLLAVMALWPGLAAAAEATPPAAPAPLKAAPVVPVVAGASPATGAPKMPAPQNETQQYCSNIAAAAADARYAWQRKQLTDLQAQLKQRIADLDAKEAEFKSAAALRDDMMKKATDTVVGIYSHMKPDAAAEQIGNLDDDMAAAILAKLSQRQAGTILAAIPAEKAAKLMTAITAGTVEKKS